MDDGDGEWPLIGHREQRRTTTGTESFRESVETIRKAT